MKNSTATQRTPEWVLRVLRRRHSRGLRVDKHAVAREDRNLLVRGATFFGSWSRALEAANIPPETVNRRWNIWTRPTILLAILERWRNAQSLRGPDVKRDNPRLYHAAGRSFGGWCKALKAASLDVGQIYRKYPWNKTSAVMSLKLLCRDNPSLRATRSKYPHLASAALSYCGTWANVRRAAGFPSDDRSVIWSRRRVLSELRRARKAHRVMWIHRFPWGLQKAAYRYFGSWPAALAAAGIHDRAHRWPAERVTSALGALAKRHGLVTRQIVARAHRDLRYAITRRFSSLRKALVAAGLPPPTLGRPRLMASRM